MIAFLERVLLLVLAVVPGSSPILLGKELRGALLLFLGLNAWNLALLGFFLWLNDRWATPLGWFGIVAGSAASIVSVVWTWRLTSPERRRRIRERADHAFQLALRAFLRGKLSDARTATEAGLQTAAGDRDLRFLDWFLACELHGPRRARGKRRRLRRYDRDDKWAWEVQREEELRGRRP